MVYRYRGISAAKTQPKEAEKYRAGAEKEFTKVLDLVPGNPKIQQLLDEARAGYSEH